MSLIVHHHLDIVFCGVGTHSIHTSTANQLDSLAAHLPLCTCDIGHELLCCATHPLTPAIVKGSSLICHHDTHCLSCWKCLFTAAPQLDCRCGGVAGCLDSGRLLPHQSCSPGCCCGGIGWGLALSTWCLCLCAACILLSLATIVSMLRGGVWHAALPCTLLLQTAGLYGPVEPVNCQTHSKFIWIVPWKLLSSSAVGWQPTATHALWAVTYSGRLPHSARQLTCEHTSPSRMSGVSGALAQAGAR